MMISIGRKTAKAGAAAALALGVIGLNASPALADGTWYIYQGDDYAVWYAGDDGFLGACDMEADGHGVYGVFDNGHGGSLTVSDTNGSAAGCGNSSLDHNWSTAKFKVCESITGPDLCSKWRYPWDGHLG
jgi:hypothetical protein